MMDVVDEKFDQWKIYIASLRRIHVRIKYEQDELL